MQVYVYEPSFIVGQAVTLCVTPNKQFAIAMYRQGAGEALIPQTTWSLASSSNVQFVGTARNGRKIFRSGNAPAQGRFDQDWQWPQVGVKTDRDTWGSGVYVAAVFEVNADGVGIDALGTKIDRGQPIYPYPPDSDAMALAVGKPYMPATANIAYVVPIATYHAYNLTGGGCFYAYNAPPGGAPYQQQTVVTMRRPGGGLGAFLGEPPDPYDPVSPRQQFAHWDAKFVRWLATKDISCDFYTDIDLHAGQGQLTLSLYQLMLSVGHHEYWSQAMRDALQTFLTAGGNYACFSGNTCYRPINFGAYRTSGFMTSVNRLADHWPDYDEWQLIQLGYNWGGGRWGDAGANFGQWTNTTRNNYGYQVQPGKSDHWIFAGTGLSDNAYFGNGNKDYLVGYECDGKPPSGKLNVLARSPQLAGFQDGRTNQASFGIINDVSGARYQHNVVFNAGTTDWARVLMDPQAASQSVLDHITYNVVTKLSDRPD